MWIAMRTAASSDSPVASPEGGGLGGLREGSVRLVAPAPELSCVERHPRLPVIYGAAATHPEGRLYAWAFDGTPLGDLPTGGVEPCSVAVSPDGRVVAVANYGGSVARYVLDDQGRPGGPEVIALGGFGPDAERQEASHPHHVAFVRRDLVVTDLGADALVVLAWRSELTEQRRIPVPPGTGPRHLAHLGGGRVVVSGELSATILVGSLDDGQWRLTPSTTRAAAPGVRVYPSDVIAAADGRMAYVANRGIDTVSSVLCTEAPEVVGEHDAGGRWPLKLAIETGRVLVACRDSHAVTAMPLRGGIARDGSLVATAPSPAWLEP